MLLEAVGWNRKSAIMGGGLLGIIALGWLFGLGGAEKVTDVMRAFTLKLSGVEGALPLVARETALGLTVILSVLSFLSTRKNAGCLGAMLMAVSALLMIWLANRPDLLPGLLPAVTAAVVLLLMDRQEDLSPLRALPTVALVTAAAWLLTPAGGLVSEPLKERADSLRQAILDRLFFTEPRDVFSLATEGFYPEGSAQLGGPVSPTDHPVMQVSTPKTVYLRGVTMNSYDGRAWRNTLGGRRYLWNGTGMTAQRRILFDQDLPSAGLSASAMEPMDVSVRMLEGGTSTLFVPQRIRELRAGGEMVPYFSNASELYITRNLQPGDTWAVSAPLFQAGDPGLGVLVDAAAAAEDPQWASVLETYTALPPHLEEPVWQMAADVTANLESPYDKAFALQGWLSRNYRYTLDVAVQPANLDFVTNFLFNTREGYCTYFASAMTVLCRMAGLPARYVEGYVARPNADGEALVTGLDAHAWTEVYFKGFGWLTFDATPRREGNGSSSGGAPEPTPSPEPTPTPTPEPPEETEEPSPPPEEETPSPEPESPPENPEPPEPPEEPEPPEAPEPPETPEEKDGSGFPWLWLLLALIPAGIALRWWWTDPGRREKKAADEAARFDLWMEEVSARLRARGLVRQKGETPMSFTRRLDAEGRLPVSLSALGECVSLMRYGRAVPLVTDTDVARKAAAGLKKDMPFPARLRYALERLLPRASRRSGRRKRAE